MSRELTYPHFSRHFVEIDDFPAIPFGGMDMLKILPEGGYQPLVGKGASHASPTSSAAGFCFTFMNRPLSEREDSSTLAIQPTDCWMMTLGWWVGVFGGT